MFKNIILIVIVFSPVFFLSVVGIPVISNSEYSYKQQNPERNSSYRCHHTDDSRLYAICLQTHHSLRGVHLGSYVINAVANRSETLAILCVASALLSVYYAFILLLSMRETKGKHREDTK